MSDDDDDDDDDDEENGGGGGAASLRESLVRVVPVWVRGMATAMAPLNTHGQAQVYRVRSTSYPLRGGRQGDVVALCGLVWHGVSMIVTDSMEPSLPSLCSGSIQASWFAHFTCRRQQPWPEPWG